MWGRAALARGPNAVRPYTTCLRFSYMCMLFSAGVGLVVIDIPALIICQCLSHGAAVMAAIDGHVMLEAVVADVFQQLLHLRNPDHTVAAETLGSVASDSPSPT